MVTQPFGRTRGLATAALVVATAAGLGAQSQPDVAARSAAAAAEARQYFLRAREGHFEVVPQALTLIEGALAADPDNPSLLYAQAFAYNLEGVAAGDRAGNPFAALAAGRDAFGRAFPVIQRARQLAPDNPDVLSLYGGMLSVVAMAQQRPDWGRAATAAIDRAIELAPDAVTARLIRQQMGLLLPTASRNTAVLIDDTRRLAAAGEGSRSGDMEHLLLADLYAELGQTDDARREYRAAVRRPASPLKDVVQSRLDALDRGGVPLAVITRQRTDSQSKCVNCHAP